MLLTNGSFCLRILTTFVFEPGRMAGDSSLKNSDLGFEELVSQPTDKGEAVSCPAVESLPSILPVGSNHKH